MHPTSLEKMAAMVRIHLEPYRGVPLQVLDFGSQMVEGQQDSYRPLFDDPAWTYHGLDIEDGLNVDICVADPYRWSEVPSDHYDLVISGQALEHVEFFWATLFEIGRVLRPGGLAAIVAPSGGVEHRFPVDCWRFYRDGFDALARYVELDVVDVFTDWGNGMWEDTILVGRKPIWGDDDRARFAERARLQRHLLGDDQPVPPPERADQVRPSPLAGVRAGALTAELESRRDERLRTIEQPPDPVPEPRPSLAQPEPPSEPTAGELARALGARLAGERGRALYRRLRNRPARSAT